jgi:hypothetical protein
MSQPATMCEPDSNNPMAQWVAAIPEEKAKEPAAPSKSAIVFSTRARVGFPLRE